MAAVSATFVTCRATGAGAKAARASNGAAARAPVAMTSKTNGVSLGARQGSRVSARAAAPARSARRVALAAVATDTKEAAPTAEVEEPGLDSEVSEQPLEDPTHSRYLPPTHSFHLFTSG